VEIFRGAPDWQTGPGNRPEKGIFLGHVYDPLYYPGSPDCNGQSEHDYTISSESVGLALLRQHEFILKKNY